MEKRNLYCFKCENANSFRDEMNYAEEIQVSFFIFYFFRVIYHVMNDWNSTKNNLHPSYCKTNFYILQYSRDLWFQEILIHLNRDNGSEIIIKIINILNFDTKFYTFVQMLKLSGTINDLHGKGPYTVLAPNNNAFSKMRRNELMELIGNEEALKEILQFHIVPGQFSSNELLGAISVNTMLNQRIQVRYERGIKVMKAMIVNSYVGASNGIVHEIDRVIKPPEIIVAM